MIHLLLNFHISVSDVSTKPSHTQRNIVNGNYVLNYVFKGQLGADTNAGSGRDRLSVSRLKDRVLHAK